jgi:hypothetical protein
MRSSVREPKTAPAVLQVERGATRIQSSVRERTTKLGRRAARGRSRPSQTPLGPACVPSTRGPPPPGPRPRKRPAPRPEGACRATASSRLRARWLALHRDRPWRWRHRRSLRCTGARLARYWTMILGPVDLSGLGLRGTGSGVCQFTLGQGREQSSPPPSRGGRPGGDQRMRDSRRETCCS